MFSIRGRVRLARSLLSQRDRQCGSNAAATVAADRAKGEPISKSFPHIGDGSPRDWLFAIIVISIGLIPFFSFRVIGRVFGERELRSLFLTPAKGYVPAVTEQSLR